MMKASDDDGGDDQEIDVDNLMSDHQLGSPVLKEGNNFSSSPRKKGEDEQDENNYDDWEPLRRPPQHKTTSFESFEVEQSLPTVAELTGRAPEVEDYYRRKRLSGCAIGGIVILFCVVLAVIIGVSVVFGVQNSNQNNDQNDSNNNIGSSTSDNNPPIDYRRRQQDIFNWIRDHNISDPATLDFLSSPQFLAADFLAFDPLQLEVVPLLSSTTTPDGYAFLMRYVLAVLYYTTHGEDWVAQQKFLSERPTCEWTELAHVSDLEEGVICDNQGMITHLSLPRSELKGTLPTELALLTTLKALSLQDNSLSGSLPEEFRSLVQLEHIRLFYNQFTGSLPETIGRYTGLKSLELSHNSFSGSLPESLSSFEFLEFCALDNNRFSGTISGIFNANQSPLAENGALRRLQFLYLENNLFEGRIGDAFLHDNNGNTFYNLTALDLSNNLLTGNLPANLFFMPALEVFDVNNNALEGSFPQIFQFNSIPVSNQYLRYLALHGNFLTGEVSGQLPLMNQLSHLDVSSNNFTGALHLDLGAITSLKYLFLAENQFPPGPFPPFLSHLTNLQELSLKSTQRTGAIPTFLAAMSDLLLLDLDHNSFMGSIPSELGVLSDLKFLLLNRNKLDGTVPQELAQLRALHLLLLDDNELTGDLDHICNPLEDAFVVADCLGGPGGAAAVEIFCSCCGSCCSRSEPCNDANLIPVSDATWQSNYVRKIYKFGESEGLQFMVDDGNDGSP